MLFSNPIELIGSLGTLSIFILLVLAFFSIVSWGVIIYKWRRFKAIEEDEQRFLRAYELHPQDFDDIRIQAQDTECSPSAIVFLGVMDRIPTPPDLYESPAGINRSTSDRYPDRTYLEKVANHIVQNQLTQQETYLPFLATTGNLTPFIGLLGTVLGIIGAFREIGVQGSASIAAVAPGVAEALVATAAGLFAAIPAVIAYNFFLTRVRKLVFRVEAFSIEFLNSIDELAKEAKEFEVGR